MRDVPVVGALGGRSSGGSAASGAGSTHRPAAAGWLPARRGALAGEWRTGDLEAARIKVGAMPGESPAPAMHPTAAQAVSEPRRYTRPVLCLEKLLLRKSA